MFFRITIPVLFLFAFAFGQDKPLANPNNELASAELEEIILESDKLDDKLARVHVRAKAAALIAHSNPARAEMLFVQLWSFVNQQTDKDFDKERARLLTLAQVLKRNPKLARGLLAEEAGSEKPPSRSAGTTRNVDSRTMAKLASELIDSDPSTAAGLLEKSLASNPGPAGLGALTRLREKDPILSDYVAVKALDALASQPTSISLPALHLMSAYAFPGPDAPISSYDAESSLQFLQYRYFLAAYDILRASLGETNETLVREQHYSPRDLQYRAANQAQVAAILTALAPRLQPTLAAELNAINARLASQLPPNILEMTKFTLARLSGTRPGSGNAEENFVFALSAGEFDEARKHLERIGDEDKKKVYTQLILKNEAKFLLAKSNVIAALTVIRKLEDQTTRLVMYLEALKTAKKDRNCDSCNIVINEARLLIPQTNRNGLHVRALLSFIPQLTGGANEDAFEFLKSAVTSINALTQKNADDSAVQTLAEAAMADINDPYSLLDAPELERAFALVGTMDLELGLSEAKRIKYKAVQLVARLQTVQSIVKRGALPSKPAGARAKPSAQ